MLLDFTIDRSTLVQVMAFAVRQQTITWSNVDPDLCRHMMSLGQDELIDVIALVLPNMHHNITVFCNISRICGEYENKIKYMDFYAHEIISTWFIAMLMIWCDNPLN